MVTKSGQYSRQCLNVWMSVPHKHRRSSNIQNKHTKKLAVSVSKQISMDIVFHGKVCQEVWEYIKYHEKYLIKDLIKITGVSRAHIRSKIIDSI